MKLASRVVLSVTYHLAELIVAVRPSSLPHTIYIRFWLRCDRIQSDAMRREAIRIVDTGLCGWAGNHRDTVLQLTLVSNTQHSPYDYVGVIERHPFFSVHRLQRRRRRLTLPAY